MIDHFKMFARYNGWANRKLYEAAATLNEEDFRRDCDVAFKSMHGTLNHLLAADLIWMSRFQGTQDAPTQLNAILHETFFELLDARRAVDDRIIDYCSSLDQETLERDFTYTPVTDPKPVTQQLAPTLAHFFNHQTHHRGQCHAILTRLAGEAPPMDLIYYQREQKQDVA